jgi:hypothetical protein
MNKVEFGVRIQRELHGRFLDACWTRDKPAAQILREFTGEYVANYSAQEQEAQTAKREME